MEDSVTEIRVKDIIYLIINISRRNSQNSFNLGKVLLFLLIPIPEDVFNEPVLAYFIAWYFYHALQL
jgi:hypothetical protein